MNDTDFSNNSLLPPVVIGGVGGSGTRLIAEFLKELGYKIGGHVNNANDNLWFALIFVWQEILLLDEQEFASLFSIFLAAMTGSRKLTEGEKKRLAQLAAKHRAHISAETLQETLTTLLQQEYSVSKGEKWGWKNPNSHIFLQQLKERLSGMKYIHVMRNGLDMAHSANQNQLRIWGKTTFLSEIPVSPYYSLKFWCLVHQRILVTGKEMGKNFFLLNYDRLCQKDEGEIERLCNFLGVTHEVPLLLSLIKPPSSIGRFRQYGLGMFDPADVAYVKALGFDTTLV